MISFLSASNSDQVDLAILIVSWNVKDLLLQNIATLLKSTGDYTARIVIVDNESHDGTVEALQKMEQVIFIANTENLGFAKATNQGLEHANARHVLLLNPDMKVSSDALSKTIAYLDAHDDVGVMSVLLRSATGSIYPSVRRFPDFFSQVAILLKLSKIFPRLLDTYLWRDFDYLKEQSVPSVRGSYFAISHRALKQLGGLDERFFIWFEEVDYCKQVLQAGLKVMHVPSIEVSDLVGRSFAQRTRYWKQIQFSRSMAQYFEKWQPAWQSILINIIRPFPIAAAWIADHISH